MSEPTVEPFQQCRNQIYRESDHLISIECDAVPTLRGSDYEITIVYNNGGTRATYDHMNHQQAESFLKGIFAGIRTLNIIQEDK